MKKQNTWYKSGEEVCVVSLVAEQRSIDIIKLEGKTLKQ